MPGPRPLPAALTDARYLRVVRAQSFLHVLCAARGAVEVLAAEDVGVDGAREHRRLELDENAGQDLRPAPVWGSRMDRTNRRQGDERKNGPHAARSERLAVRLGLRLAAGRSARPAAGQLACLSNGFRVSCDVRRRQFDRRCYPCHLGATVGIPGPGSCSATQVGRLATSWPRRRS